MFPSFFDTFNFFLNLAIAITIAVCIVKTLSHVVLARLNIPKHPHLANFLAPFLLSSISLIGYVIIYALPENKVAKENIAGFVFAVGFVGIICLSIAYYCIATVFDYLHRRYGAKKGLFVFISMCVLIYLFIPKPIWSIDSSNADIGGMYSEQIACPCYGITVNASNGRLPLCIGYVGACLRTPKQRSATSNLQNNDNSQIELYCESDSDCTTTCGGTRGSSINNTTLSKITPAMGCSTKECRNTGNKPRCVSNQCTDNIYTCDCC